MTLATNTATWDLCCDCETLGLGAGESSCGERKEDGKGLHFAFFLFFVFFFYYSLALELEETVGYSVRGLIVEEKRELRDRLESKKASQASIDRFIWTASGAQSTSEVLPLEDVGHMSSGPWQKHRISNRRGSCQLKLTEFVCTRRCSSPRGNELMS